MPIDPHSYNHRGGGNFGVVVRCPNIVSPDRLVYFDHNRDRGTWVIRDFIAGLRLDDLQSQLTVAQIEADANYDGFPAWCNAEENPEDWRNYIILRTTAVLRLNRAMPSHAPVNRNSGAWQPL